MPVGMCTIDLVLNEQAEQPSTATHQATSLERPTMVNRPGQGGTKKEKDNQAHCTPN